MKTRLPLLALASLALALPAARAVLVDFDAGSADLADNFNQTNPGTWNATAGVGGSGGVITQGTGGGTSFNYNQASFAPAVGVTHYLSVLMLASGTNGTSSFGIAHIGWSANGTANFGGTGDTYFGVRLEGVGSASTLEWSVRTSTANGGTAANTAPLATATANAFNVTTGNWYLFTAAITKSSTADEWTLGASLQDYGTNGASPGAVVSAFSGYTLSGTVAASLYGDGSLFAAYNVRNTATGLQHYFGAFDHAYVDTTPYAIPEPSAFAALAGLAALSLAAARRR